MYAGPQSVCGPLECTGPLECMGLLECMGHLDCMGAPRVYGALGVYEALRVYGAIRVYGTLYTYFYDSGWRPNLSPTRGVLLTGHRIFIAFLTRDDGCLRDSSTQTPLSIHCISITRTCTLTRHLKCFLLRFHLTTPQAALKMSYEDHTLQTN